MGMRTSDIPYVSNGYLAPTALQPLEEMSLGTIVKTHLMTCAKSKGLVSTCMKCTSPCAPGLKAIELTTGKISPKSDRAVPYEGSLLQKARAEADAQRKMKKLQEGLESEIKNLEDFAKDLKEEKKARKNRWSDQEGWYEEAQAAADPVEYAMNRFGISKTQAKKKIYAYRRNHGLLEPAKTKQNTAKTASAPEADHLTIPQKEAEIVPEKPLSPGVIEASDEMMTKAMERKLETLMNQQEEYEGQIKKYQQLLTQVKDQIDTICKTIDIFKGSRA